MLFHYLKKELGTYAQLEKCGDEQQIIKISFSQHHYEGVIVAMDRWEHRGRGAYKGVWVCCDRWP